MPRRPIAYQAELLKCGDAQIAGTLTAAIESLFAKDLYLLERNVHERTVAATLAFHMRGMFGELDVDAEFNKLGDDTKRVHYDGASRGIVPDIIVHKRGDPYDKNLLAMEIKCAARGKTIRDLRKLGAMRIDLRYKFALFIRFDVKDRAGSITELCWV